MMKQLNKIVYVCALALSVLFAVGTPAFAAAPGATCATAIPLGKDYMAQITKAQTIWYSAWTFDLPLTVYFAPQNETDPAPEVEMDFGCKSGFYTDSILCSLFCANAAGGVVLDMPHKPNLQSKRLDDGTFVYYISLGKKYRDLLLQTGISYNLEVFVKVTYHCTGKISIAPDGMFTNCMDGHKFIHLGDTVKVKTLDKNRHVVVPYVQWRDDSIRYVWDGTAPVRIAVSAACDFDPDPSTMDERVLQNKELSRLKDTLKVTSEKIRYYIDGNQVPSEAGMFFAKFYTEGTGVMKIERVPQAPPRGGATLLRYDKLTPIPVTTPEQMASPVTEPAKLFAIPYTWTTATLFTTPTDHVFRMYIGTDPDFTAETAIATYQFNRTDTCHWLGLKDEEMQALWTNTREQYLYVRFECTAKTTLTPKLWTLPSCISKANLITYPSCTFRVEKGSYGAVYYCFYYDAWRGGDMKFEWKTNASTCPTFIGMNCTFPTSASNTYVLDNKAIAKNGTWVVSAQDIEEWAGDVDENGYLYIRFNPTAAGTMTITSSAPEEEDPAPIVYPSATIAVVCDGNPTSAGQQYNVLVSKDQVLSLYSGDITDIAGVTPMDTWSQTVGESHALTLSSGVYVLRGQDDELLRIVVE